jgi:hypothetical protein
MVFSSVDPNVNNLTCLPLLYSVADAEKAKKA